MKRIQYLLLLLTLVSCNKRYSTIEINKTSCETISPTDTVHVDSMIPMNLFLYKQYIVTTAPQSNFAKTPYELYDKDNLRFIARAGAFGHSGNEVIDVNPYFIDRNENSFHQCVYGNYLTECTFREGKLNIIEKKLLGTHPINLLCKIDDSTFVMDGIDGKQELVLYHAGNKEYTKLCNYPTDIFPITDKSCMLDYYNKSIAYVPVSDKLMCFYVNIPLVREINLKDGKDTAYVLKGSMNPKALFNAYMEEAHPIVYTMAKHIDENVYALYHGTNTDTSHSEIHVWNAQGKLIKRWRLEQHLKCFEIDGKRNILYGIYSDEKSDILFKAKITN